MAINYIDEAIFCLCACCRWRSPGAYPGEFWLTPKLFPLPKISSIFLGFLRKKSQNPLKIFSIHTKKLDTPLKIKDRWIEILHSNILVLTKTQCNFDINHNSRSSQFTFGTLFTWKLKTEKSSSICQSKARKMLCVTRKKFNFYFQCYLLIIKTKLLTQSARGNLIINFIYPHDCRIISK